MSAIRVVLTVTPSSPELYAALKDIPARMRAERVRTLATLGLAAFATGAGTRSRENPLPPEKVDPPPARAGRAMSFAKSLGEDL